MTKITLSENEAGQRLDKLLTKYLNKAPKSFIYKMLRKKNITLNGKKAGGEEKTVLGDEIIFFLSDETMDKFSETTTIGVSYDLDILYEDKHILIINKPVGMLSQKAGSEDVSLNEYILSYLFSTGEITSEELRSFKPGICNRLDRNTSGIVIAGKSLEGLQTMASVLKDRTIHKYYQCIVKGSLKEKQQIEGYLLKDEKVNKVTVLKKEEKGSAFIKTEYEPICVNDAYSLLNVKLITGRSHQIRAHLAGTGHPIIGDYKYGTKEVNDYFKKKFHLEHQLLHSYRLIFPPITGALANLSNLEITAPLPEDFKKIKETLF